MRSKERMYVIFAPHADDEIIGCYRFLKNKVVWKVLFASQEALQEAKNSRERFDYEVGLIEDFWESQEYDPETWFLFPDPTYELHPLHRHIGMMGEDLVRRGAKVIFYTTNMNAPYIVEILDSEDKKILLDQLYPQKSSLWEYDHKYFLFEGFTQWIIAQ